MKNFVYNIPTRILFGKGMIKNIAAEIKKYSDRVLLTYGGGSIKKNGIYDEVIDIFKKNNIFFKELSGIKPNPRLESVKKGVKIIRENNLGFILALGGGSTIDASKAIAAGVFYDGDPWDFCIGKEAVTKALPLGSVLTLAATGSEMNGGAVITKEDTEEKRALHSDLTRPTFSILDPGYTFTVPKEQTAAGTIDIFSHVLEQYFSLEKGAFLQDRLSEAVMTTCIKYGRIAIEQPQNYEARANLMWASSLGLNGLLTYGRDGDWATHMIEHEISAIYDLTHGVGLAILTPHWMEYVLDENTVYKFVEYAKNVWGITDEDPFQAARKGIESTKDFFCSLDVVSTLREAGIDETHFEIMANQAVKFGPIGQFKKLGREDIMNILHAAK